MTVITFNKDRQPHVLLRAQDVLKLSAREYVAWLRRARDIPLEELEFEGIELIVNEKCRSSSDNAFGQLTTHGRYQARMVEQAQKADVMYPVIKIVDFGLDMVQPQNSSDFPLLTAVAIVWPRERIVRYALEREELGTHESTQVYLDAPLWPDIRL